MDQSTHSTTRCDPALRAGYPDVDTFELADYKVRILAGSSWHRQLSRAYSSTPLPRMG